RDGKGASQVSREHMIFSRPGFVTIAGGKLTTYRKIAMQVVDAVMQQLGAKVPSATHDRPLPGSLGLESDQQLFELPKSLTQEGRTGPHAGHLALTFGTRGAQVAARVKSDPALRESLDPEQPYLMAQVDEAVEREFARTLDDVLTRRIPLLLQGRDQGLAAA